MRYGIFSDIHADLTSAREVVERLRNHEVDALVCLGDIVGYGAQPNECVEYIAGLKNCTVIAGNHDWACSGVIGTENFRPDAAKSVLWTRDMLGEKSKQYLSQLPLTWKEKDIIVAHASPVDPAGWKYISDAEIAREVLEAMDANICFIGHTHYPAVARLRAKECEMTQGGSFAIEDDCKYLVNVGSAGYLRRVPGMVSYVLYDEKERRIEMFEPR